MWRKYTSLKRFTYSLCLNIYIYPKYVYIICVYTSTFYVYIYYVYIHYIYVYIHVFMLAKQCHIQTSQLMQEFC